MKIQTVTVILVLTIIAAYGLVTVLTGARGATNMEPTQEQAEHTEMAHEIVVRAIEGRDGFYYTPEEIHVKVGEPVRLVLDNRGRLLHDLTVEHMEAYVHESSGAEHEHNKPGRTPAHELEAGMPAESAHMDGDMEAGIHIAAEAGQKGVIEFTPEEAGTYEFYCSVPGHRQLGMVGVVIVES